MMFNSRYPQVGRAVMAAGLCAGALLVSACGDKPKEEPEAPKEVSNAIEAMGALAKAGSQMGTAAEEAAKFQQDRRARGDTVSMSYTELQKYLPDAPSGYSKAEEPGGSSQSIGSFSMSEAEQKYVAAADANGNTPTIRVKIVDFGGTEGAYGMFALPMMMNIKQEDAHRRMGTIQLGPEHTWASEEFNKDNKDAKVTAITRYRYVITVEADNQSEDQSDMVRKLTEKLARRFEGK
jgi:hypothetical protein